MQNLLFVVSDDLFVELYRLAYGGKVDIFVDAVDAVELLIVYVYRRKAQGARADVAQPAGVGARRENERSNRGVRERLARAAADILESLAPRVRGTVELMPLSLIHI